MADSGILFPLILGVTMQQVIVITQAQVPQCQYLLCGTRAWVITNLLHCYFEGFGLLKIAYRTMLNYQSVAV